MLKEQSLPLHIAKAGVDYFFSTNESRHIRFYGPGEPTQEFELMKNIVDYARKQAGDVVTTEIQTNGCFGQAERDWMLDNMNIIWVSFDGDPEIQNANRPCIGGKPSAPIIEKNVKWLLENKGSRKMMVGSRVTITDTNVARQKQIVDYFHSIGIKNIWTDPLFPTVDKIPVCDDEAKLKDYCFDMDAYIDNYIEAYFYAKEKDIFYGSFLACNFDGVCNKHCRACTPTPHFTSDGYVSACDLVTFGEEAHHMNCFVYGKWTEETQSFIFDDEKIKLLQNRSTNNMEHCRTCKVKEYCGGYCLGEVMNETGSLIGQKPKTCQAIHRLYETLCTDTIQFPYMHP